MIKYITVNGKTFRYTGVIVNNNAVLLDDELNKTYTPAFRCKDWPNLNRHYIMLFDQKIML